VRDGGSAVADAGRWWHERAVLRPTGHAAIGGAEDVELEVRSCPKQMVTRRTMR
jgi:hypothetical protein